MIEHRRRGLAIIIGTVLALCGTSPTVLAQSDADRVLAQALEDWKEGSTTAPLGVMERLAQLGPDAAPAVPRLIAALGSPDPARRARAARTLKFLGSAARPAIPALIALLRDPDPRVSQAAMGAITILGRMAESSIPALVQILRTEPERQTIWPLVAMGEPAVPVLIELLKDPNPLVRKAVVTSLNRLPWTTRLGRPTTITRSLEPQFETLAHDPDLGVRIALINILVARQNDSDAAIATLRILFHDSVPAVRLALIEELRQTGTMHASLRPAYFTLLKDQEPSVRIQAATWLPSPHLAAPAFIDALLDMLKDPAVPIRVVAAQKLTQARYSQQIWDSKGRLSIRTYTSVALARSPTALAVLKSALADPEPRVRATAASLLPIWQGEAATLIPLLTERLKDPIASVRGAAATALVPFGPATKSATRAVLAILADPGTTAVEAMPIAVAAAQALEAMGGSAKDKMLRILLSQLNSLDDVTRTRARAALQNLGNKANRELFHSLIDPRTTRRVRFELMWALNSQIARQSGPESLALAAVLRTFVSDEDPQVSRTAIWLLSRIDPQAPEAVAVYFAGLRDNQDKRISNHLISSIIRTEMIPQLVVGLSDDNPEVRMGTVRALAVQAERLTQYRRQDLTSGSRPDAVLIATREQRQRLTVQVVQALISTLKEPDIRARWIATFALGVLESEAETVVPILIEMAKNATDRVSSGEPLISFRAFTDRGQYYFLGPSQKNGDSIRIAAMQALGSIGSAAAKAVPMLVRALRDPDLRIRWFAAESLALMGPAAKAAVPALIEALRSRDVADAGVLRGNGGFMFGAMDDGPIRLIAAEALGQIGPDARAAIPDLIAALSGPDSRVRSEAARALGAIGPEAAPAIPELVRLLTRGHHYLAARWSQDALVQIGAASVPSLLEVLRDKNPDARQTAIETLGKLGTRAASAIPQLIAGLNDPAPPIRVAAAQALGEIGSENSAVITTLVALLKNPVDDVSDAACDALLRIGKSALPAVLVLTRDDDPGVRKLAFPLLYLMASPNSAFQGESQDHARNRSQVARTALRTALGDRDKRVRSSVSAALRKFGGPIVPDLIAALDDPAPAIRTGAAQTLASLGDDAFDALESIRRHRNDADPEVRRSVDAAIRAIEQSERFEVVTIPNDQ